MKAVQGSRLSHIEHQISNKTLGYERCINLEQYDPLHNFDLVYPLQLIASLFAMATTLPIPAPPRTPTPPPEDEFQTAGLGLDGVTTSPMKSSFDPNALSPMVENFPVGRYGTLGSATPSPVNPLSPASTSSIYSSMSIDSAGNPKSGSGEDLQGPFNFQTTTLAKSPVARSVCPHVWALRRTANSATLERWPTTRS